MHDQLKNGASKEKLFSPKASLGDVARAAKISTAAASFALTNRPGVSKATRERVRRIAQRLGYAPDARIASWMARMREAKAKSLLPIAWLNFDVEEDAWHKYKFLSPYLEGARERSLQLGYQIEELWIRQPGMTMRRLSQILYQRGIEGVIVTYPARHLRLKWDHLACVALGGALLAPGLHRVRNDNNFNLLLAMKSLRRLGYRRIGICLAHQVDQFSHHGLLTVAEHFSAATPKADRIPPLVYFGEGPNEFQTSRRLVVAWMQRHQPEVIVGSTSHLLAWVKSSGARVPEDVGLVHLSKDDDVLDWAGIHSNKREIGATGAELVISLMQNHRFGIPEIGHDTLIRGSWSHGRTLSVPTPRLLNLK